MRKQETPLNPNSRGLCAEGPLKFPAPSLIDIIVESFSGKSPCSPHLGDKPPYFPESTEKQERLPPLCQGGAVLPGLYY